MVDSKARGGALFRYTHYLARFLVDRLATIGAKASHNETILIVRPDGIGDFIVWLGAAEQLREHYAGRRMVLLANTLFAELAGKLGLFDQVVAVDPKAFETDLRYRYKMVRQIRKLGADVAIHPVLSRYFWTGDAMIRASGARERIGADGDFSRLRAWQNRVARRWYTRMIPLRGDVSKELERNTEFLTGLGIEGAQPTISKLPVLSQLPARMRIEEKYFVIFPGAGSPKRFWPPEAYAEVAARVANRTGWRPVVCGGPGDVEAAQRIVELSNINGARSLAGETTLPELVEVIRRARLLIGNETSAVHIAATVDTPSVCLLGGGHFGRFVPYPENIEGRAPRPVFHRMDCYGCNWQCTQPHEPGGAAPCISAITPNDVVAATEKILLEMETNVAETT